MGWQEHARRWTLVVAAVFFLGFLAYVIWPYRRLPSQIGPLTASWAAAAPSKGTLDGLVGDTDALAKKASAALPTHKQVSGVVSSANTLLDNASNVADEAATGVRETFANVNRKCAGLAGPDACGTLAEANKVMVKVQDAIVTTQLQQRTTVPHINAAMDAFKAAAESGQDTLETANKIMLSNAVQRTLEGLGTTATQLGGVTTDLHAETTRLFNPVPCSKEKHPGRCRAGRFGKALAGGVYIAGRAGQAALPIVLH